MGIALAVVVMEVDMGKGLPEEPGEAPVQVGVADVEGEPLAVDEGEFVREPEEEVIPCRHVLQVEGDGEIRCGLFQVREGAPELCYRRLPFPFPREVPRVHDNGGIHLGCHGKALGEDLDTGTPYGFPEARDVHSPGG